MMTVTEPAGPIRTLLHSAGVPLALKGFDSLRRALGGVLPGLVVHDDGSLTHADCERMQEAFPGTRVISRAESDDLMAPVLEHRPYCRRYRSSHAFGIKLLDVLHLAAGPVRYLDGDILFLKRLPGLFPAVADRACTLHEPTQNCQSASLRALVWKRGLSQIQQLNAGAYFLPHGAADLDFFEWFLSKPDLNGIPMFAEQTLISVIAARHRPLRWSPQQFVCRWGDLVDTPQVAAIHFIGNQKAHFAPFVVPESAAMAGLELAYEDAPVLSRLSLLRGKVRSLLR